MRNNNSLLNDSNSKYIIIMLVIILIYFIISYLDKYRFNTYINEGFNERPGIRADLINNTNFILDDAQKQLLEIGDLKTTENKYIQSQSEMIINDIINQISKKKMLDITIKTGYSDKGNKCIGNTVCSPITGHKCNVHLNNKRDEKTGNPVSEEQFCKRILNDVSYIRVNSNSIKYELLQPLKQLLSHIQSIKDNQTNTIDELIKDRTLSEDMLRQQTFFENTNNKIIDMKLKNKDETKNSIMEITDEHNIDRENYNKLKDDKAKFEILTSKFVSYSRYILFILAIIIIMNMSQVFIEN